MDLLLERKLTLKAHGRQVVFVKKKIESIEHVLMKAFLWALYLPQYPNLLVEVPIRDKYKPDLVALDDRGEPTFWGESGKIGVQKIRSLTRRYRSIHFAIAKWNTTLFPLEQIVVEAIQNYPRAAPIDLLSFPGDSTERFISPEGEIQINWDKITWKRI